MAILISPEGHRQDPNRRPAFPSAGPGGQHKGPAREGPPDVINWSFTEQNYGDFIGDHFQR